MLYGSEPAGPLCPICERPMKAARPVKRFFGLPNQKHYECHRCAVTATVGEVREEDLREEGVCESATYH